jgi:hypothetical protein
MSGILNTAKTLMQSKTNLPVGKFNVNPVILSQPNGIISGYFKNYKNEIENAYKDFYKVDRNDDYFDAFYNHLKEQAPMVTTKTEAYEIKNPKKPDEEPEYVTAENFESDADLQKKINKGSRTAKLIKDYSITEKDTSMDATNSYIIGDLVKKYFPNGKINK